MKQYLDLLKDILDNGEWKEAARSGMPRTKEVFGRIMKFDLQEGFPLLTTKRMHLRGIVAELLWFLSGSTNVYDLNKMGCKIWNEDAYRYYKNRGGLLKKEAWLELLNSDTISPKEKKYFDCGNIYGHQWGNFGGDNNSIGFHQIMNLIENIKVNPNSRYHIVTAWNPIDFLLYKNNAALPACHMMFQCSVREGKYIDMIMMQRSADTFLGVPYNIASYSILTHIIAHITGYEPGVFTWVGNSVHLYENHMQQVNEQLSREPYKLCKLNINHHKYVSDYKIDDFTVTDYTHHDAISAPLSVGK